MLAGRLIERGHVVRGTTRDAAVMPALEAAGVEPFVGDPDRIGTLVPALDHVSAVCILLGSAAGEPEQLAAIHGSRLEMLLHKLLDTTARGIVYEAAGSVPPDVLERGAELVRSVAERSRIPYGVIEADPSEPEAWVKAAVETVVGVLD
jgi:hypothetical protein